MASFPICRDSDINLLSASTLTTLAFKPIHHITSRELGQHAGLDGYIPRQEHIISTSFSAVDSGGSEHLLILLAETRTMENAHQHPTWIWVASFLDLVRYQDRISTRDRINRCNHHLPEEMFSITRLMNRDRRQEKTLSCY